MRAVREGSETTTEKRRPITGHKCVGLTRWVQVRCECGWTSDLLRPAEQAGVYNQWRRHAAKCGDATAEA